MLNQEDADKIRKLKGELDDAEAALDTANREAEAAANRLKQVRTSIRPAARTRFTRWLTNSDPEEHRRYRQAKEEQKNKNQLASYLEPRIAAKDANINAAVAECLKQSNREYQSLETQRSTATNDRRSCDEALAMTTAARRHIDAALERAQQFRDRDTKETRKATTGIAAEVAGEMSTLKKRLTALVPRLRAHGSFSNGKIQQLRTEFSGGNNDFRSQLATTSAALNTIGSSLASASKRIAEHRHALEKKQRALVQKARAQVLGS